MRINQFIASASGISRRAADRAIADGRVYANDKIATMGQLVNEVDVIKLDGLKLALPDKTTTIIMNKPAGFVCSRDGQGSKTIYDLLPVELHTLKSVGRLDKDSSGLLLITNNGQLANRLTHPSFAKRKVYNVFLDRPLEDNDRLKIDAGITLDDGLSSLELRKLKDGRSWEISMTEGRNRQIRRTFAKLRYSVLKLKRLSFGEYSLNDLAEGSYKIIE